MVVVHLGDLDQEHLSGLAVMGPDSRADGLLWRTRRIGGHLDHVRFGDRLAWVAGAARVEERGQDRERERGG